MLPHFYERVMVKTARHFSFFCLDAVRCHTVRVTTSVQEIHQFLPIRHPPSIQLQRLCVKLQQTRLFLRNVNCKAEIAAKLCTVSATRGLGFT